MKTRFGPGSPLDRAAKWLIWRFVAHRGQSDAKAFFRERVQARVFTKPRSLPVGRCLKVAFLEGS